MLTRQVLERSHKSTTTEFESTAATWSGADTVIYLSMIITVIGGAVLYASVLAMAANWANHKKKFIVRKLILIWAWAHPALLVLPFAFGPRIMLQSELLVHRHWVVFLACWTVSIVAWILILTTRVDAPRRRRAGL